MDVMSRDLMTVSLDTDAMEAFDELARNRAGRLLVFEGDEFVGILTRTDLARAFEIIRQASPTGGDRQLREPTVE